MHDCFSSNWTVEGVTHGVCNAHTLRELQTLIAIEKKPWASDMKTIQFDALELTNVARSQDQGAVSPEAIKDIERRFDICCEKAVTFHENQLPLTHPSNGKKRGRPVDIQNVLHWGDKVSIGLGRDHPVFLSMRSNFVVL